ncbi:hypothetical protein F4678DRAFT_296201 [Xylaria arbuscula]|nr:hypothetical protein F4678DRAFT_296201 [Xylaria arbuscula]
MEKSTDVPTLPPVEWSRTARTFKRPPQQYSFSVLDLFRYYTGTDPDLIWGPYYQRFRAAQLDKSPWIGFNLRVMWDSIPATTQTRPGSIQRFLNWAVGIDPSPTLTPPPAVKKESDTSNKNQSKNNTYQTTSRRDQKTFTGFLTVRSKVDSWQYETGLKDDGSPTQIDFTEWYGRLKHPQDYNDKFYHDNYEVLYHKVCDLADKWFGAGIHLDDLRDSKDGISAWEAPMTEQFIQYARLVAHEDSGYVEWKDILDDPQHRKWLCVSIFAQIIEKKVFNELLFGASHIIQQELDRHDHFWLLQEGFTRKEGRRQIARSALGGGLIPEHFWDAVDDLAGRTVLIFQPLLTLVALGTGRASSHDEAVFWQEVHSIIALAGYFQICMAVSPSIFHVLSASPGARFQWEEEAHADTEIYRRSKGFHKSHEDRWRVLAELSSNNDSAAVTKLVESMGNSEDSSLYTPLPTNEEEYRLEDHQRRRGGKVMYAVFPKLTRYAAENVGEMIYDPKEAVPEKLLKTGEGMRISIIYRCMVVYYQGPVHSPASHYDGITLEEHLDDISWSRTIGHIIPYFQYYWDTNGNPAVWFSWPAWPKAIDKYWLWWLLFAGISQALRLKKGGMPFIEKFGWYSTLVFQSFIGFLIEVAVYLVVRSYNWPFLRGRWLFLQVRLFNLLFMLVTLVLTRQRDEKVVLFSLLTLPLVWADKILLNIFPALVMDIATGVQKEGVSAVISRLYSAVNATVAA